VSHAVLHIDGDTSGLRRALGEVPGYTRRASAAINASDRQTAANSARFWRQYEQERDRLHARMMDLREKREQKAAREAARAATEVRRAQERAARDAQRAEERRTASLERETRHRETLAQREAHNAERMAARASSAYEREEQRKTRVAQREAARRLAEERGAARRATRDQDRSDNRRAAVARQIAGAVWQGGVDLHGQIQGARERRAETEHNLNAALYQAGIGGAGATEIGQRLRSATAAGGELQGLSLDEVVGAVSAAQTQFSVLGRSDEQRRAGMSDRDAQRANMDEQVRLLAFARNTFQAPEEVLRAAGMLRSQGLSGEDAMSALRSMTGMAQAGSIELSTMISSGLGPLMANIASQVTGTMTPEQRRSRVRSVTEETMATGEIAAAAGLTPRDAMNALAKLRRGMGSERVAGELWTALQGRGQGALAENLLESTRGPGGQTVRRFRSQDAIGNISKLLEGFGGNAGELLNTLQGGTYSHMVVDAQTRRLIGSLGSQTASGQTIAERVAEMRRRGSEFGAADEERGKGMVLAEQRTRLRGTEEQRLNALSDNTTSLNKLSNTIADWLGRHPIAGTGLGVAKDVGLMVGGGALAKGAAGGGARALATRAVTAGRGALGAAGGRAGGLLGRLARFGGAASFLANLLYTEDLSSTDQSARESGRAVSGGSDEARRLGLRLARARGQTGAAALQSAERSAATMTVEQLTAALREALNGARVTAVMDPATVVHAQQVASTAPPQAPASR